MRAYWWIGLWWIGSCAPLQAQRNYYEDLSGLRPEVPPVVKPEAPPAVGRKHAPTDVLPTHHVNAKVDAVLDSIARFNRTRKFVEGFTIQVYSGPNREEAIQARKRLTAEFATMSTALAYVQPKFRVTAGGYYSFLEAQRDFQRIKRAFPNATLVPEKIAVRQ